MVDMSWMYLIRDIRVYRRDLIFSKRRIFDDALRPSAGGTSALIAYPDAFYHVKQADFDRAKAAVEEGEF